MPKGICAPGYVLPEPTAVPMKGLTLSTGLAAKAAEQHRVVMKAQDSFLFIGRWLMRDGINCLCPDSG
jgi:hypothetical protein